MSDVNIPLNSPTIFYFSEMPESCFGVRKLYFIPKNAVFVYINGDFQKIKQFIAALTASKRKRKSPT